MHTTLLMHLEIFAGRDLTCALAQKARYLVWHSLTSEARTSGAFTTVEVVADWHWL